MTLAELLGELDIDISEGLLLRSLTHSSYANEHPEEGPSNERMEFLGDAVLNLTVSDYLFRHRCEMQEGGLSLLRSTMVRAEALADCARRLRLGERLRLGRGESESGGQSKGSVLADAYEAVVACVYLSGGYDAAYDFVLASLGECLENLPPIDSALNPKSALDQWARTKGYNGPIYRVVKKEGPDHCPLYTVEVVIEGVIQERAFGRSKQTAEERAAGSALIALDLR